MSCDPREVTIFCDIQMGAPLWSLSILGNLWALACWLKFCVILIEPEMS